MAGSHARQSTTCTVCYACKTMQPRSCSIVWPTGCIICCALIRYLASTRCVIHSESLSYSKSALCSLSPSLAHSCLSKVEKLLDSITYRFLNDSVIHRHVFKSDVTKRHNYQFNQNSLYTNVPFSGPNYNAACKTHLEDSLFPSKKMEACMYKVIREYEKSLADPKVAETHKIIFNRE